MPTHAHMDVTHLHGDLTRHIKSRHIGGNGCTQSSADGSAPTQLCPAAAGRSAAQCLSYNQMSSVRTWFRGSTLFNRRPMAAVAVSCGASLSFACSWCHLVVLINSQMGCIRTKENTILKALSSFNLQAVITERKRSSITEKSIRGRSNLIQR